MKKALLMLLAVSLTAVFAVADGPSVSWSISNLQLNNPTYNYTWNSPTAVAPNYGQYYYEYNVTKLEAELGLLGWQDVTSYLDGTSGSGTVDGPCPITLFNESIVSTDPPATVDMTTTIDEYGYAHVLIRELNVGEILFGITPSAFKLSLDIDVTPLGDPIPEPVSMMLLAAGGLPLLLRRKK